MPQAFRRAMPATLWWTAVAAVVLASAGCAVTRLRTAAELARESEPMQRPVEQPRVSMLIVGDSTAVGTGASTPQASLAGLLAQAYPKLHIENRGRDGATFEQVARQLDGTRQVDVVLVLAGGNDVIRLRDLDAVRGHLEALVARAKSQGRQVVLMPAGNVGNAPFFFPPVSWWMSSRARRLHDIVREVAHRQEVGYVRLFKERDDDPFARQRELNARDGLHPSDSGYRLWFDTLLKESGLAPRLADAA